MWGFTGISRYICILLSGELIRLQEGCYRSLATFPDSPLVRVKGEPGNEAKDVHLLLSLCKPMMIDIHVYVFNSHINFLSLKSINTSMSPNRRYVLKKHQSHTVKKTQQDYVGRIQRAATTCTYLDLELLEEVENPDCSGLDNSVVVASDSF